MSEALSNLIKSASELAHVTEKYLTTEKQASATSKVNEAIEKVATTLCDFGWIPAEKKAEHVETMSKDPAVIAGYLAQICGDNFKQANEISRLASAIDDNKSPASLGTPEKTAAKAAETSKDFWLNSFGANA